MSHAGASAVIPRSHCFAGRGTSDCSRWRRATESVRITPEARPPTTGSTRPPSQAGAGRPRARAAPRRPRPSPGTHRASREPKQARRPPVSSAPERGGQHAGPQKAEGSDEDGTKITGSIRPRSPEPRAPSGLPQGSWSEWPRPGGSAGPARRVAAPGRCRTAPTTHSGSRHAGSPGSVAPRRGVRDRSPQGRGEARSRAWSRRSPRPRRPRFTRSRSWARTSTRVR